MNKTSIAMALLGCLILGSGCKSRIRLEEEALPNIIFLMDDQHRWDALGMVNSQVVTPNLDRLAGEGIFFDQAVCQAPMCIASRNSMMLGLYPNQIGVLRNEPGIPDGELPAMPLAQLFRESGYETAGFGKTHWGVNSSTRGFETRYCSEIREDGAVMMIDTDPEKKQAYNDETLEYGPGEEDPIGYIGRTSGIPEGWHRDGWITDQCLEYLDRREDSRPLFLYLSFMKPHAGHNVPKGYEDHYDLDKISYAKQPPWDRDHSPHAGDVNRRDLYEGFWKDASEEQWKEMTMRYYANCTWMDAMYGRVLDRLEKQGLLENALIIYVSDHGEMLGERYYRFNKYCLYDASVRVPVIMSGTALPDGLKGKLDHRPAELVDVYPTLLSAAGIEIPEYARGEDLLSNSGIRSANFCGLHERADEAAFMWRNSEYKLILRMARNSDASTYSPSDILGGEFYDLKQDPQEWSNLYGERQMAEKQNQMESALLRHLKTLKPIKSKL